MIKKVLVLIALCIGLKAKAMEPRRPSQPQQSVSTLSSLCSKAVLKDQKALLSLPIEAKRKLIFDILSTYCTDVSACNLGNGRAINYCGDYRFLTPGAMRDAILNKDCACDTRAPLAQNANVVTINGTIAEQQDNDITLHLWDERGIATNTCTIQGDQLCDSYSNCCFIVHNNNLLTGEEDVLWYRNKDHAIAECLGKLIHWYDCIECSKVFFLLEDGLFRIFNKKTCTLEVVQLKADMRMPSNFVHADKQICLYRHDEQGNNAVLTVLNSQTYGIETEYPCDFEHGYCHKIIADGFVQCKYSDNSVEFYDLKNKMPLASFKTSCQYDYLLVNQKPCVVIIPRSEDELVQIWDLTERQCIHTFENEWHYHTVCAGNVILERENKIVAWNIAKQEVVLTLGEQDQDQEAAREEHAMQVLAYDRYLIVGDGKNVKIWDMSTYTCVQTLQNGRFDLYTHNHILMVNHDDGTCSAFPFYLLESLQSEIDSLTEEQVEYVTACLFYVEAILDARLSGDLIKIFAQEKYRKLPELIQNRIFNYFEEQASQKGYQITLIKDALYTLTKKQ